jgi:hypothetical protein
MTRIIIRTNVESPDIYINTNNIRHYVDEYCTISLQRGPTHACFKVTVPIQNIIQ